jgi:hypothetical protein
MFGLVVVGILAVVAGYLVLTSWDVTQGGVNCGAPLDNPGWRTGVDCHGAVNRQTAAGWVVLLNGLALLVVAASVPLLARLARSRTNPE